MPSPIEQAGASRGRSYNVPIDKICLVENWNVRLDYGDIEELAKSIAAVGVRTPLVGYMEDGFFWVTDGHRRMKAIEYATKHFGAEFKRIPVQQEARGHDEKTRLLTMLTANSGKPLEAFEIGLVAERLVKYGWTFEEIAEKVPYSAKRIEECYMAATAGEEVVNAVKEGEVSGAAAVTAIREYGDEEGKEAIKKASARAKDNGKKKATVADVKAVMAEPLSDERKQAILKLLAVTNWQGMPDEDLLKIEKFLQTRKGM